jgi:glycosyltransferase involved in cell wall biosynthesis
MRVGLVMPGVDAPLTGVTRVALEIGRALQRRGDCELVFLTPYRSGPFRAEPGTETAWLPGGGRVPGMMVLGGPLVALAARRHHLDLVYDPVGVSPFTLGRWAGRFKRVVAVHDAIAFRFPGGYHWLNNVLHRRYVPATLRNVDDVVTVSRDARADLEHYLSFPAERMFVVPNGVGEQFRPIAREIAVQAAARYGLVRPFVLHVGVHQARKNLARLVDAFARVHEELPDYQLVLAGPAVSGDAELRAQIEGLGLVDEIVLLGRVDEADLPAIYSATSLLALPSLFEGFGLPIVEAMACGTPVVCSDRSALPETAGGAASLVDPTDVEAMAGAIGLALTDEGLRQSLRERGLARAAELTWDRAAESITAVFRSILEPPGTRQPGPPR